MNQNNSTRGAGQSTAAQTTGPIYRAQSTAAQPTAGWAAAVPGFEII